MKGRVLLVVPTTTYKAEDFIDAASRLGVEVVVASNRKQALEDGAPGRTLTIDFDRVGRSVEKVRAFARDRPIDGVVAADDETVVVAAELGHALGLAHNPVDAARATRDKVALRRAQRRAGLRAPRFRALGLGADPSDVAEGVDYPCVVKPTSLSASRGVIRADDRDGLIAAFSRVVGLLERDDVRDRVSDPAGAVLIEDYVSGVELSLEGILEDGHLRTLAVFDKPDTPEGPTFEETLFVTPSRLPATVLERVETEVAATCRAVGLVEGPLHGELRVTDAGEPWVLEIAARTIGGLCARSLRFGAGISLEELVVLHAVGLPIDTVEREAAASGVLMLPVPRAGVFDRLEGVDAARAIPEIVGVAQTVTRGTAIEPVPEGGHRYVGFVFARAETPEAVEAALRLARETVRLVYRDA